MRFRPAGEGIELGGDFYDLFAAGDGAWTALIGDVQGKGPDAAAVTALARHTMRAAAAYESRPSRRAGAAAPRAARPDRRRGPLLHRLLRPPAGRARARSSSSSPAAGTRCRSSCTPTGASRPVGRLGTLLGSDIEPLLTDVAVTLGHGEVLVLYTDGVTEVRRRRQEVFGHRELVALLETCAGLPPDAVADRVEAAVMAASEGRLRDDMAILAFGPTPQPKETDG